MIVHQLIGGLLLALSLLTLACGPAGTGTVQLRILADGRPTPARVELTGPAGRQLVPDGSLAVAGDCGWKPIHNWIGWWARVQLYRALESRVHDVTTGTDQFYTGGEQVFDLSPGGYRIRAFKGPEYEISDRAFAVAEGRTVEVEIELERWIDMPAAGWFGADDHLHIPRPHPAFDDIILRWMAAEDLHVANLLQMGLAQDLHITPQRSFGPDSLARGDAGLVASGQENPRTHVAGHAIILGASEYIDFPQRYLSYGLFFREARRQGGISGFAHWGLGGADEGLAVWGPRRLVDFLEVLGFGVPYYATWYDLLDVGLRITPTAGTDYPCGPYLPGRDRFYTLVGEELTWDSWLAAVERGRTFVTNGPMLELTVEDGTVGDEILLERPGEVRISGRVRFDPERDAVDSLELVQGGAVVERVERASRAGLLEFDIQLPIESSTWLALRAGGSRVSETPLSGMEGLQQALVHLPRPGAERLFGGEDPPIPTDGSPRPSSAHTAPVYVVVRGTPAIGDQPGARAAARRWLRLLDRLERRFEDEAMDRLAGFPGRGDGLTADDLTRGRGPLMESITAARKRLERIVASARE